MILDRRSRSLSRSPRSSPGLRLSDPAASAIFIVTVLGVSLATARIADGLVLALSPLLVTLAMLVLTRDGGSWRRERRLGMSPGGLRWWPVAVATTAGVSVVASGLVVLLGHGDLTSVTAGDVGVLAILLVTGTVLAFCEEIGWRGYLQPRVASWAGRWGAYLVIGLVWVAWHLPYILLTDGYHPDGNRVLVLTLFTGSVLVFSVLFGLLRDLSGSVWPAVVGHVAHNAVFAWLGTEVVVAHDPVLVDEYLAGDTGLFVLVGTAVAVAITVTATRRRGRATSGTHQGPARDRP